MKIYNNVSELVGATPIIKLNQLARNVTANIYVKLEYFNPSRSVKDRAALNMILEAENNNILKKGATIIEPSSGNTGIGLAMLAAARGYKCIIVMPDSASHERINILKAYGAKVVLTPAEKLMQGAIIKTKELADQITGSFIPNQFTNPANPAAHRKTTALEIISQLDGQLDAFVACAGTGGTITGTGKALLKELPDLKIYTVESKNSPVLAGGKPGTHSIPGTGPGFIPTILDTDIFAEILHATDEDVINTTRKLAVAEGLLLGLSSGAAIWAALQLAKKYPDLESILAIAPDSGERYLSEY